MTKQEKNTMMLSLANRWRMSGVSQEDFARDNNITVHALRYWLYKRKELKQENGAFLQLSGLAIGNEYLLRYPNGIELKLPGQTPVAIIICLSLSTSHVTVPNFSGGSPVDMCCFINGLKAGHSNFPGRKTPAFRSP